jgi:hypothetical protein
VSLLFFFFFSFVSYFNPPTSPQLPGTPLNQPGKVVKMQFLNSLLFALASLTVLASALPKRDWDDGFEPKVTKCNLDKAVLPMNNETGG